MLTLLFAISMSLIACGGGGHPSDASSGVRYRVLFIGNSLTASNDLPGTVAHLAASAGDTLHVHSVTRPNFAVIDHASGMSNAVAVIRQGSWDYVILQQGPTSQQLGRDTLIIAAKMLEPEIRAIGAQVAFLMVWPAADHIHNFDGVLRSCREAAQAVNGLCLPAGEAWRGAWARDEALPLYGSDRFHPSLLGTYLAALVAYEGMTGQDARSLPQEAVVAGQRLDLPGAIVALLQQVAHETVTLHRGSSFH